MKNPWEEIPLDDYENHMKLDSVMQLQVLNEIMKHQLEAYSASRVMILGVAGGNGFEHISENKFEKVFGVDINSAYLKETAARYPNLNGILECLCVDLTCEFDKLPQADLVVANLLIEYIGCECFQKAVRHIKSKYVSCVIQINCGGNWVSNSPYLRVFDGIEQVHRQIDGRSLKSSMLEIGYRVIETSERLLPNGKKLARTDFERQI